MWDFLSRWLILLPDFGRSDVWHQNFAFRFLLSQSLKQGYLPLWSRNLATGFPLLAEGQTGILNLSNLVLFSLFNPVLATNLTYLLIFLVTFSGTYFFSRSVGLKRLPAFFSAMVFTLSGMMVTQTRAIHLIQTLSFLPWEFFLAEKIIQTKKNRWSVFFAFILAQQIFSGYFQIVFISFFSLAIYLLTKYNRHLFVKAIFWRLALAVSFGAILALPQILPTWEFTRLSFRSSGIDVREIVRFPYNPKMLLAFISPYLWGNPARGTYPPFSADWGIFWESTGYIGILPLILIPLAFLSRRTRDAYASSLKPMVILAAAALVLTLSKYTPFMFVLLLPPFSLFRVPARFLIPVVWALTIISGFGLEKILRHRFLSLLIVAVSFLNLIYFAVSYLPVVDAANWLEPPPTVNFLKNDPGWYRIYTVKSGDIWNNTFLHDGWQDMRPYFQLRGTLDPDANLYWQIPSADYYAGNATRRTDVWASIISVGLETNSKELTVTISSASAKLLSLAGIKYLLSPYALSGESRGFFPVATMEGKPKINIYQNPNSLPHAYLTRNYIVAQNASDLLNFLQNVPADRVVLENPVNFVSDATPVEPKLVVTKNSDLEVDISADAPDRVLLVLSDSYYPGWQATVDGRPVKILPANLNQRAVVLESGRHKVVFTYNPWRFAD